MNKPHQKFHKSATRCQCPECQAFHLAIKYRLTSNDRSQLLMLAFLAVNSALASIQNRSQIPPLVNRTV
jgi:hypothetical protein